MFESPCINKMRTALIVMLCLDSSLSMASDDNSEVKTPVAVVQDYFAAYASGKFETLLSFCRPPDPADDAKEEIADLKELYFKFAPKNHEVWGNSKVSEVREVGRWAVVSVDAKRGDQESHKAIILDNRSGQWKVPFGIPESTLFIPPLDPFTPEEEKLLGRKSQAVNFGDESFAQYKQLVLEATTLKMLEGEIRFRTMRLQNKPIGIRPYRVGSRGDFLPKERVDAAATIWEIAAAKAKQRSEDQIPRSPSAAFKAYWKSFNEGDVSDALSYKDLSLIPRTDGRTLVSEDLKSEMDRARGARGAGPAPGQEVVFEKIIGAIGVIVSHHPPLEDFEKTEFTTYFFSNHPELGWLLRIQSDSDYRIMYCDDDVTLLKLKALADLEILELRRKKIRSE